VFSGRVFNLRSAIFSAGDPGCIEQDIKELLAVTTADVIRVYEKYIKGKNYIATSFVPKGKLALALDGSTKGRGGLKKR
jgi:zinc protease